MTTSSPSTGVGRGDGNETPAQTVFSGVVLPCGRTVANRLVKVAMYEHLAAFSGGLPNHHHLSLYSHWAKHGWGMVITGNVQVSKSHLTLGRDMVIPSTITEGSLRAYRDLASAILNDARSPDKPQHGVSGTLAVMQLSHAGRQSPNVLGGRLPLVPPLAPSAISFGTHRDRAENLATRVLNRVLFLTPRAMSETDIDEVVDAFVRGARIAVATGFHGVQLHAAHGYLLAQFMSPMTNSRHDSYSADLETSLHLVQRIVLSIRAHVPSDFVLGIKINSADYVDRGSEVPADIEGERRAMEHIRTIASWRCVDFVEISGGNYENPEFMDAPPLSSASSRQALFARFSHQALHCLEDLPQPPLILLTGGLRTPAHLYSALRSRHAHLLGIGRGSVLCPDLPRVLKRRLPDDDMPFKSEPNIDDRNLAWLPRIKLVGAGAKMAWYVVVMRGLAMHDRETYLRMGGFEAVLRMFLWVDFEMGRFLLMASCVASLALILLLFYR